MVSTASLTEEGVIPGNAEDLVDAQRGEPGQSVCGDRGLGHVTPVVSSLRSDISTRGARYKSTAVNSIRDTGGGR